MQTGCEGLCSPEETSVHLSLNIILSISLGVYRPKERPGLPKRPRRAGDKNMVAASLSGGH